MKQRALPQRASYRGGEAASVAVETQKVVELFGGLPLADKAFCLCRVEVEIAVAEISHTGIVEIDEVAVQPVRLRGQEGSEKDMQRILRCFRKLLFRLLHQMAQRAERTVARERGECKEHRALGFAQVVEKSRFVKLVGIVQGLLQSGGYVAVRVESRDTAQRCVQNAGIEVRVTNNAL